MDEYQREALRTAGNECRGSVVYSMGGIGGEAGEYVDVVKKHLFHGVSYKESREKALKELGDLFWGLAQAADVWDATLSEVAQANVDKLRARYPDGFTTEASKARVDTLTPEQDASADEALRNAKQTEFDPVSGKYIGWCSDRNGAYWCTRNPGHSGRHVAANFFCVVDSWPADPTAHASIDDALAAYSASVERVEYAVIPSDTDANGSPTGAE